MIPQGLRKLWLSRIEIYPMLCLGKLWAEGAGGPEVPPSGCSVVTVTPAPEEGWTPVRPTMLDNSTLLPEFWDSSPGLMMLCVII